MSLFLHKPSYPHKPIWSLENLADSLRVSSAELQAIAALADRSYRRVELEPGSTREVFSAKPRLKEIQKRVKFAILMRVSFPNYLTGSLKGCDYITNAQLHSGARVLICEDVTKFFPSVSAEKVFDIWRHFFGFSDPVAQLLTRLTTKAGSLPQGASTSSYLANLVLWREEPLLQAKLGAHGITYSRYVDDMSMSCKSNLSPEEIEHVIADVYGMLRKNGLSAKRKKHEVFTSSERMIVTKVVVNAKPSVNRHRRAAVRTQVHVLEQRVSSGETGTELYKFVDRTGNLVGQLGRFHKREAELLRQRVRRAREILQARGVAFTTTPSTQPHADADTSSLPWE
jgi:hypothetical protein